MPEVEESKSQDGEIRKEQEDEMPNSEEQDHEQPLEELNRIEINHLKQIFKKFVNQSVNSKSTDLTAFLKTCKNLVKGHVNSLKAEERAYITVDMEFTFIRRLFVDQVVTNEILYDLFASKRI